MRNFTYGIARVSVSFVWFYHGLVPKLLMKHPDEAAPLLAAGFSAQRAASLVVIAGWSEMAFALSLLIFWKARAGFYLTILAMAAALIGVAATAPRLMTAAFNPVSLNICMIALSTIGLLSAKKLDGPP